MVTAIDIPIIIFPKVRKSSMYYNKYCKSV